MIYRIRRTDADLLADERGGMMPLVAICSTILIGMAALVVDLGQSYVTKAEMQTAADMAAAAAVDKVGNASDVVSVGTSFVNKNLANFGYTTTTTVQQGTWNTGTRVFTATNTNPDAVKVTLARNTAGGNALGVNFASILGITSVSLSASAVAYKSTGQCMVALEPTQKEAIFLNSQSDVRTTDCTIFVKSNGETPAIRTNSFSTAIATGTGDICAHSFTGTGYTPSPGWSCVEQASYDPLAGVTMPTVGACVAARTDKTFVSNTTVSPGTWCKKFEVNSGVTVTMEPGTYVFRGAAVTVNSGSTLKVQAGGAGVFIYLVYDGSYGEARLNINSNSTADLWAMPTGSYAGVLVYQAYHASNGASPQIVNSGSTGTLKGTVYLPQSTVTLNSFGDVNATCGAWIADKFFFNSDATFDLDPMNASSCGFPLKAGAYKYQLVQ